MTIRKTEFDNGWGRKVTIEVSDEEFGYLSIEDVGSGEMLNALIPESAMEQVKALFIDEPKPKKGRVVAIIDKVGDRWEQLKERPDLYEQVNRSTGQPITGIGLSSKEIKDLYGIREKIRES